MQDTLKSNTIALTTKTEKHAATQPTRNNFRPKKGSYTVDAWRILKKEDTLTVDENTWYWCTKDHCSKGIVHNGIYALHKPCDNYSWSKDLNDRKAKAVYTNPKAHTTPSTTQNLKPAKKLALSESLHTELCTQSGLSSDAADCIWSDA